MAQDFNMHYCLVDVHGNSGSQDGDPAAAMRYTEARLSKIGELMLRDINKDTVDMIPNYDESEEEAVRLPSLFSSLLCNGTSGIAVGMASSFLPHMAKDVFATADRIIADALQGKETTIDTIISILKAPDFPTGGLIIGRNGIQEGYRTGRGSIKVRSRYEIETKSGHDIIRISEIPYHVNKANMVQQIAEAKKKFNLDIQDVNDFSAKGKIDVVVKLKRGANTQLILKKLLKHTDMETTCHFNHTALVDGKPVTNLNIKDLFGYYIQHCVTVVQRRTTFDLNADKKRAHILEALERILSSQDNTDKAIAIIRGNKNKKAAIAKLMEEFSFDEVQATYVGDQKLWNLNPELIGSMMKEYESLMQEIRQFEEILGSPTALLTETREELKAIAKDFEKEERRTDICADEDESLNERDYIEKKDIIVTYTHNGLIKAVDLSDCSSQGRAGKGNSLKLKDDDFVRDVVTVNTHDDLLVVTNTGKGYVLPAFKIPIVKKTSVGKYVSNYVSMSADESIVSILPILENDKEHSILFVTKNGVGKRITLDNLPTTSAGAKLINIREDDALVACSLVNENDKVLICTEEGLALRTPMSKIRIMGRSAAGNILMRFKTKTDHVIAAINAKEDDTVLVVTQQGFGKRLDVDTITVRENLGGKGMAYYKPTNATGKVTGVFTIADDQTIIVVTKDNMVIRTPADDVRKTSRAARGVRLINLKENDFVISASAASKEDNEIPEEDG